MNDDRNRRARNRARHWHLLYQFLAAIIGIGLIARMYSWQVIRHGDLTKKADQEHVSEEEIPAQRGVIYDANGHPFVSNVSYDLVFAVPSQITNPEMTAEKLAPILGMSTDTILKRFSLSQNWVSLAHQQPPQTSKQISDAKLDGIGLQPESKRVYPDGSLAAQVLGFTSYDGVGHYGIEGEYNKVLSGTPGRLTAEHDVAGNEIDLGDSSLDPPKDGADLYLSIDQTIQYIVEKELAAAVQAHGATGGTAIMMNPHTGAILAMASVPTYDPNNFTTTDAKLFTNPSVSGEYEPGSTFKIVTLSTGLDTHVITPETTMQDTGSAEIGGFTIWDWDHKAHGNVTMTYVLDHSLNLGAAFVGRRIGAQDFYRYVQDFGFGQPTGVDLQGEIGGTVRTPDESNWYAVDLSTNSFGQGLTATPLQVVTAVSAVANGGAMMRPYVVQRVVQNGTTTETVPQILDHPVTPQTAKTMTQMMVDVTVHGEGTSAQIPGFKVAGKTGTAQIAENGVYLKDQTIASFIGFAPAQDPAFVLFVKIDRPKDTPWGADTAAPTFASIARQVLLYMHVQPTEPLPSPTPTPRATPADTSRSDNVDAQPAVRQAPQPRAVRTPTYVPRRTSQATAAPSRQRSSRPTPRPSTNSAKRG